MTTISSLVLADHDDWIPLWQDYLTFYESELSDEVTAISFSRLAERDGMYAAIARDDLGRAVGFVHWTTHSSTWNPAGYCYLEDLFVDPHVRGGGVGQALIAHVHEWADSAGCGKVYWLTQETNTVARALYDRVAQSTGFVHYEIPISGA
jgi:GNAT superfamily N-acetyltransferase